MQPTKPFSRRVYFIRDSSQPHLILGIQVIYLLLVFFSSIVLAALSSTLWSTTTWQATWRAR